MPVPKSVTKVYKTGSKAGQVEFTSSVDRVNYTIEELTKAALRDVGKVIIPRVREATPKKTGLLSKSWQKWVKKSRSDGHVELDLGVYSAAQAKKKGQKYAHHAHLVLFGHQTADHKRFIPGNNFFYQVVADNISLIRDTEAQYLSAIEDEQTAIKLAEAEADKEEDSD